MKHKKPIKFYIPQGEPVKVKDYTIKVIKTKHGLRKMAVGEVNGRKVYQFVK